MSKQGFVLYNEFRTPISMLSLEDAGALFHAIFEYEEDGTIAKLPLAAAVIFSMVKKSLDRGAERYEDARAKNSENAKKRWNEKNTNLCGRIETDAKLCDRMNSDTSECETIRNMPTGTVSGSLSQKKIGIGDVSPILGAEPPPDRTAAKRRRGLGPALRARATLF